MELTKVVERATPFQRTTVPFTNPVPLTVKVNPTGSPALTDGGESVVMDGLTTRFTALETPPPGNGLKTVIGKLPEFTVSVARITAVNCVGLT